MNEHKIKYQVKRNLYKPDEERWQCSCGKQGDFTTPEEARAQAAKHMKRIVKL